VKRSPLNPILTRADIPELPPNVVDVSSVFNPGAIRVGGKDLLLLRVQTRGRETVLMVAESTDGERFRVRPKTVEIEGLDAIGERIYHVYDPRLTQIEEMVYVMFAADTDGGCRLGVARTADFEHFELVGFGGGEDTRNGVLFPERRDGHYLRLERPNRVRLDGGVTTGSQIVLSESENLADWRQLGPVMNGRPHYWDELIGSGPPPVKTRVGWLHIYHGIATHFATVNIYQAGVVLLDLNDPRRVLGRSRNNILEPREQYELAGQVPNVVFPGGMIVDQYDNDGFARLESPVRVFYGAADTVVALATTTVEELMQACSQGA
jgi:beta-1,4-mannooligosaccharide/beta-1,4-mannosyl-N-acetylglucosamine phosphorylase